MPVRTRGVLFVLVGSFSSGVEDSLQLCSYDAGVTLVQSLFLLVGPTCRNGSAYEDTRSFWDPMLVQSDCFVFVRHRHEVNVVRKGL